MIISLPQLSFAFLTLCVTLFFPLNIYAQPANDLCADAITAPTDGCITFTEDLTTGTSTLANCGGGNEIWYSFTAAGPSANIEVTGTTATACIGLIEFPAAACDLATVTIIESNDDMQLHAELTPGNVYYIAITLDDPTQTNFDLCIDNPTAPPNNETCDAIVLPFGGCIDGTTEGADALLEGQIVRLACSDLARFQSTIWYTVTLSGSNNIIELDITGQNGDINVGLWDPVPCDRPDLLIPVCTDGAATIVFENTAGQPPILIPGNTYLISITTYQDEWDELTICAEETFIPPCAPNGDCGSAQDITVDLDFTEICQSYCNGYMPGFDEDLGGCFDMPNGAAWFTFTTGGVSSQLSVSITSSEMENPMVSILTGNCGNLEMATATSCSAGASGLVELSGVNIPENTTVFILVSDFTGFGGNFEMCTFRESFTQLCVGENQELQVISRLNVANEPVEPLSGPYCAGDQVHFCFNATFNIANSGCQWIQGIVPSIGEGWDIAPGENPGGNVPTVYSGDWTWYDQDVITYNHNNPKFKRYIDCDGKVRFCKSIEADCEGELFYPGMGMPAGWYVYNTSEGPQGPDANSTWGDGFQCVNTASGPWEVCFTLVVKGSDICNDPTCTPDLSLSMMTTSDGETGGYTGGIGDDCVDDPISTFEGQMNCAGGPDIITAFVDPLCSGSSVNVLISSTQGGVAFSWIVTSSSPGLSGFSDGNGNLISDFVRNTSMDIGEVEYTIYAVGAGGCPSEETILVEILPELRAEAGDDLQGCASDCLNIGEYQLGTPDNNPLWTYSWTGGLVSDPTISDPTACPDVTTTYTVTVSDGQCPPVTDQVTIEIFPVLSAEIFGDDEVCLDIEYIYDVFHQDPGTNYAVTYNWFLMAPTGGEFFFGTTTDPTTSIIFNEVGIYYLRVEVTDQFNCITEATYSINVNPTPIILLNPNAPIICDGGSTEVTIGVVNEDDFTALMYEWTSPSNEVTTGAVIMVDEIGIYMYRVWDDITGCEFYSDVEVESVPGITTSPTSLTECDEGGNQATFDLTTAESAINPDPTMDFNWFIDEDATMPIADPLNHVSANGSVWVVLTQETCTSMPFEVPLTVVSSPVFDFPNVNNPYCENDASFTIVATPEGGTFSGNNVTAAGLFNIGAAGAGSHIVQYMVTMTGCTFTGMVTIEVTGAQTPILNFDPNPICSTSDSVDITADLGPGTYVGVGITDAINGTFNPADAGVGIHAITYTTDDGCTNEATINIEVINPSTVVMDDLDATCQDETSVFFSATPIGGTYTGTGIVDATTGEFNPNLVGPGTYSVTYTLTEGGGCEAMGMAMVTVEAELPVPSISCEPSLDQVVFTWNTVPGVTNYIINTTVDGVADEVNLNTNQTTYTVAGLAEGIAVTITVSFVGINSCGDSAVGTENCATQNCDPMPPTIEPLANLCENSMAVNLTATPLGGEWTGVGVDDATATFDPRVAGPGTHQITYTYIDDIGCHQPGSVNVIVEPLLQAPVVSCGVSSPSSVTINWTQPDPSVTDYIVTYQINSGTDIVINTTDQSITITPLVASDEITISVVAVGGGVCGDSPAGTAICLADPCPDIPFDLSNTTTFCENEGVYQLFATPTGGTFSSLSAGVSADGMFDPAAAGPGNHTITYTVTSPGDCMDLDEVVLTVDSELPAPVVNCAEVQLDEITYTWSTYPGVTDYIINTTVGGVTGEVDLLTTDNMYVLGGLAEGVTVEISVVYVGINSCGNSPAGIADPSCITQACVANPPTIDPVNPLCQTAAPVALNATPNSGTFSGLGVNEVDGTFDPNVTGPGDHEVSYQYVDEIGCPQINSIIITVEEILDPPTVNCINTSTTSVEISWSHPNTLVTDYEVSYQIMNGSVISTSTNMTSLAVTGLNVGDIVSFEVIAIGINSCGNSDAAVIECIAQDCPPDPINLDNTSEFCIDDAPYQVLFSPAGGVLTSDGAGLDAAGLFNPTTAGPGQHTITYMFDNGANCFYEQDTVFTVYDIIDAPNVACAEQSIDGLRFEWDGPAGAEFSITYRINGGTVQGPELTTDLFKTFSGLAEADRVEIFVAVVNNTVCGNSEAGTAECVAIDCDLVILGLPEILDICDGEPVDLEPVISGSGVDYSYEWSTPLGTLQTKDITVIEPGEYSLEVSDERGCITNESFMLNLNPLIPLISITDPACFGDENGAIRIEGISGGVPAYQVAINDGPFMDVLEFTELAPADYKIDIRDAEGCIFSEILQLSSPAEFLFELDTMVTTFYGDSLIYNVEVSDQTDSLITFIAWTTPDPNIQCTDCFTLVTFPIFTTTYVLNVETALGCPGQGQLTNILVHDREVFIPNVFRPGSTEADNQLFRVFTSEEVLSVDEFQVFNRWGNNMFKIAAPYDPRAEIVGWDGLFNGVPAAVEVYVYWVKVTFTDGTKGFFNGDVTLLR